MGSYYTLAMQGYKHTIPPGLVNHTSPNQLKHI